MPEQELYGRIIIFFGALLSLSCVLVHSQVTLDSSFVDDLGADSLDVVELIMALEQEFNIEIPDEDAEKIITVNDAVQYVTNNIK